MCITMNTFAFSWLTTLVLINHFLLFFGDLVCPLGGVCNVKKQPSRADARVNDGCKEKAKHYLHHLHVRKRVIIITNLQCSVQSILSLSLFTSIVLFPLSIRIWRVSFSLLFSSFLFCMMSENIINIPAVASCLCMFYGQTSTVRRRKSRRSGNIIIIIPSSLREWEAMEGELALRQNRFPIPNKNQSTS